MPETRSRQAPVSISAPKSDRRNRDGEVHVLRRNKRIGLIECSADQFTMNAIAQDAGLIAETAGKPDQFYLVHSGRNLASELETDLFAAVEKVLDHAARQGVIPPWSMLERPQADG
jgi:hypothetical protein